MTNTTEGVINVWLDSTEIIKLADIRGFKAVVLTFDDGSTRNLLSWSELYFNLRKSYIQMPHQHQKIAKHSKL